MTRWIVLLRGVNVGGHNKLKMAAFREALTAQGFADVQTYIQSGNAILSSDAAAGEVEARVSAVLKSNFDIDVPVFVLSTDALDRAVLANPFAGDLSRIMLWFCFDPLADFDEGPLSALLASDEEAKFSEDVIYLHAPSGIARSKFAEKIDRLTPVQLTARNLRTGQKLLELATGS